MCVLTVHFQIYSRAENHTSPQIQTLEVNMNMIDKVSYVKPENLSNYLKNLNFEKSKYIKSMCGVFNNRFRRATAGQ